MALQEKEGVELGGVGGRGGETGWMHCMRESNFNLKRIQNKIFISLQ